MLNPRHDARAVDRPSFRMTESTPRDVLAGLRALKQPQTVGKGELLQDHSAAFALEDFARRHMGVRDSLAWRASNGEALSDVERATLHALDVILDDLEAPPPPLSPEAQEILRDLRHVLRR